MGSNRATSHDLYGPRKNERPESLRWFLECKKGVRRGPSCVDVSRCVEICGGTMSFKFKLGDIIIPRNGDPKGRAKIEAFHLNGFMRVLRLDNNQQYIVRDKDYERLEEETFELNN
jgi:hypothetical protein